MFSAASGAAAAELGLPKAFWGMFPESKVEAGVGGAAPHVELTGPQERFHRAGKLCSQGRQEGETWLELLGSESLGEGRMDTAEVKRWGCGTDTGKSCCSVRKLQGLFLSGEWH